MKYLTPLAILLCVSIANAETNQSVESAAVSVQKTTSAIAQRLINILRLTSISESEQASLSLKQVVVKALDEGKQMPEIRLAANLAVTEITGRPMPSVVSQSGTPAVAQAPGIVANPAELSLDPATGKMMATVLPGESIFRLAQRVYGKDNGRMYLEIFAANRDKIKDINVVVEGQSLIMP
ncbi:MAG: LysM peptidoglycan-binding domain-containing protein [Leucothrix sp.]